MHAGYQMIAQSIMVSLVCIWMEYPLTGINVYETIFIAPIQKYSGKF